MGLPKINPIDTGHLPRGTPMDYLGSRSIFCPRCGWKDRPDTQQAEVFRVIVGRWFGVTAHLAVRPFLKRAKTAGKVGKRGELEQCKTCRTVYLDEKDGFAEEWAKLGYLVGFLTLGMDGPGRLALVTPADAESEDDD